MAVEPVPQAPPLPENAVHVWRAALDRPAGDMAGLARVLSAGETGRAEQFHFERDRLHFIAGRGILRIILARYLGFAPARIRFRYNTYGKPALARPAGGLYFNLSHSHGLALYALGRVQNIGIDVERIRPLPDADRLVGRFFSAGEQQTWRNLPENRRQTAFFYGWTRKEAFIKAMGNGLSYPPDRVEVSLWPEEPARLLPGPTAGWQVYTWEPAAGYVASLTVQGPVRQVTHWDFDALS